MPTYRIVRFKNRTYNETEVIIRLNPTGRHSINPSAKLIDGIFEPVLERNPMPMINLETCQSTSCNNIVMCNTIEN